MSGDRPRSLRAALACIALAACRGSPPHAVEAPAPADLTVEPSEVVRRPGAPPIAIIARDGDPLGALAAALSTATLPDGQQSIAAIAIAALLDRRLTESGVDAAVTATFDGVRARVLAAPGDPLSATWAALERTLTTPVRRDELDAIRPAIERQIASARTGVDDVTIARCRAEPAVPTGVDATLTVETLDRWRRRATRAGSLAFAVVGPAGQARALALGPVAKWHSPDAKPDGDPRAAAAGHRAARAVAHLGRSGMRVRVAMALAPRGRAVDAARHLTKDPARALAGPFDLTQVSATLSPHGSCLALESWSELEEPQSIGKRASAQALALVTLARNAAREARATANGWVEARREPDPRAAADLAAWWTLARDAPGPTTVDVAVSPGRDSGPARDAELARQLPDVADLEALLDDGAERETDATIDLRVRVEAGQGELWVLVGAACGSAADGPSGEGATAVFATAAARDGEEGITLEPLVLADSVAILAHGPPHEGESSAQHARRVTLAAARAFDASPLDPRDLAQARAALLARASEPDARAFATLAAALAPHAPQSFAPLGSAAGLARITDGVVHARTEALRSTVRRIGMLATSTDSQGREGARAVRSALAPRSAPRDDCAAVAAPRPALAGLWPSPRPRDGVARLLVGIVTGEGATGRARAEVLEALLASPEGGLGRALTSFARSHEVRALRGGDRSAVVVTVTTPEEGVDAAFAQLRGYLAQMRSGALSASLAELGAKRAAAAALRAQLDPRRRLMALFDPPATTKPAPTAAELRDLLAEERLAVVVSKSERPSSQP